MDPSFFNKSPKGLLKGLEKVLLDSSRALANITVPDESDEESEKGTEVCINCIINYKCIILKQEFR